MRKLIIALIICAALPGIIIIPLSPFAFLIIGGEGRISGMAHEYIFMALLLGYPVVLLVGGWGALFWLRRRRWWHAAVAGATPLVCALLLVWVFIIGGVQLI